MNGILWGMFCKFQTNKAIAKDIQCSFIKKKTNKNNNNNKKKLNLALLASSFRHAWGEYYANVLPGLQQDFDVN